ncbi:MAG TPA: flagellar basal body rod C-terminal domain-containing protein, partial [Thermoguttaceae bacterium]|nr:flagellar basal body rod C-terminal domain-containing protein [Thermoguttaceae bacterium]
DRANSETQEETYIQLEGLVNELTDTDLSTSLTDFFSSISEILNQPESVSVRQMAVLNGVSLASSINRLAGLVGDLRSDLNSRVENIAERINQLTEEIRVLNIRIAEAEGGSISNSDAVGLRDQRMTALEELAELVDVRVREQPSGGLAVYAGGSFLVFEGARREVAIAQDADRGTTVSNVHLAETDSPLEISGGELHGLVAARDDVLGGFLDRLDYFAGTLAFEFNKVFSGGQGLNGYQELTSVSFVDDGDLPLDEAGLDFTPVNGSFQVQVHNKRTGISRTTDVFVDLNHLGDDTTLDDLAESLDAVDGIAAAITSTGELTIASDSSDVEFYFANDTSGVLAALGLNTFFSGSTAIGLEVNRVVRNDPAKFAARRTPDQPDAGGSDDSETANAQILANLLDQPIRAPYGQSLSLVYDRMVGEITQGSALARAGAEGDRVFEQTLRGQSLSVSGVNLDEEAVRLITYQYAYQASARYIAIVRDLIEIMVSL